MSGFNTSAARQAEIIETAPPGTVAAFELSDGTALSGKIVSVDHEERSVTLETAHGTVYGGVLFESVLWVKTGARWPRWVYNRLKGYSVGDDESPDPDGEDPEREPVEPVDEKEYEFNVFKLRTLDFVRKKLRNKSDNEVFEAEKEKYYLEAGEYFERGNIENETSFIVSGDGNSMDPPRDLRYTVRKIQKSKIEFDGEKTFIALRNNKPVRDKVIDKTYKINSWLLFSEYMKKLGADVDVIRELLDVEYTVNLKALDNESELGNVELSELQGCYSYSQAEPYFTVTVKETKDEN